MALTYSSMLDLQTDLIKFELLNSLTNKSFSSDSLDNEKPSLIMFICNHCPYVIHYHEELVKLANEYLENINMIAISSNDIINYPQDRPEMMKNLWNDLGLSFPYLFDETQAVPSLSKTINVALSPSIIELSSTIKAAFPPYFFAIFNAFL